MIGPQKLRNAARRIAPGLVTHLRADRVNSELLGTVGFIEDPQTGKIVYVNTGVTFGGKRSMYRLAESLKDFTGGQNYYTDKLDADELIRASVRLMERGR